MFEIHDESETEEEEEGEGFEVAVGLNLCFKVTAGVRSRDSGKTSVEAITS